MLSIVLAMAFIAEQRIPLLFGLISLAILILSFVARVRFGTKSPSSSLLLEAHRYQEL
jgi:hypothetical protein